MLAHYDTKGLHEFITEAVDLNGDGLMDIAVSGLPTGGDGNQRFIGVLLNQGNGLLGPMLETTLEASGPRVAWVNADEAPDFLTDGGVIWLGHGDGTFEMSGEYPLSNAKALEAPDLNGDGLSDLVAAHDDPHSGAVTIQTLLNLGSGRYSSAISFEEHKSVGDTVVWDLDGDGKLDIAYVLDEEDAVGILFHPGDGMPAVSIQISTTSKPKSISLSDLDGDGDQDIIVVSKIMASAFEILVNEGSGTFKSKIVTMPEDMSTFVAVDLDGDGPIDLVYVDPVLGRINFVRNQGGGNFAAPAFLFQGVPFQEEGCSLAAVDLDGNGLPDLLATSSYAGTLEVLLNQGSLPWTTTSYNMWSGPAGLALGDLDGDGLVDVALRDVIFGGAPDYRLKVLRNLGGGKLGPVEDYPMRNVISNVFLADLSYDGFLDMVVSGDHNVEVLLNHGDGTFAEPVGYDIGVSGTLAQLRDMDGDGRTDVVFAGSSHISMLLDTCK